MNVLLNMNAKNLYQIVKGIVNVRNYLVNSMEMDYKIMSIAN